MVSLHSYCFVSFSFVSWAAVIYKTEVCSDLDLTSSGLGPAGWTGGAQVEGCLRSAGCSPGWGQGNCGTWTRAASVPLGVMWLASLASLVSLSLKHNVRSLNWLEWAFRGRWNSRSALLLDSLSSLLSLEHSSSSQALSTVKRESFTFMLVIVGKVAFFFFLAFMLYATCDIKKKNWCLEISW